MATKPISQREARRLKKRVKELEEEKRVALNQWRSEYPGGVCIRNFTCSDVSQAAINTAQKLGCAIIGKLRNDTLYIYAIPTEDLN